MALEKIPFYRTRLDEERELDKSVVISVRLNKVQDRQVLDWFKQHYDVKSDSTMLKIVLHNLFTRLQWDFSPRYIEYLLKTDRNKLSNWQDNSKQILKKVGEK